MAKKWVISVLFFKNAIKSLLIQIFEIGNRSFVENKPGHLPELWGGKKIEWGGVQYAKHGSIFWFFLFWL